MLRLLRRNIWYIIRFVLASIAMVIGLIIVLSVHQLLDLYDAIAHTIKMWKREFSEFCRVYKEIIERTKEDLSKE